jgi:putative tricarboxylic transport membrane protein
VIDPFLLWVHPDRYASWEDFHAACRADRMTGVGTGARTEDEIQLSLLQIAAGCESFRYVPESGGGNVASGVAGQQHDMNVN